MKPRAATQIWTIVEQSGGRLNPVSFELLAWGRKLADKLAASGRKVELCSVVLCAKADPADVGELICRGADVVYLAESRGLARFLVEPFTNVLECLARLHRPDIIIAAATRTGRTFMPHLAVRLHTGLTADCTELDVDPATGNLIQIRPAIGGNILATILTARHRPQMATVRPKSIQPLASQDACGGWIVRVTTPARLLRGGSQHVGFRSVERGEADIQAAEKIVAGGRGLKKAQNFALVRGLASALGAAVGASREAVDRGWMSYPHQVGLSGKTVAPRLYVAVGVSGAIQHLAGMKTSGCIVAVNNDPSAPIFQVADFGVVGDLFDFLPALTQEIERRRRATSSAVVAAASEGKRR